EGVSGDYGSLALRKRNGERWQPLFEGAPMTYLPALDQWHTLTVRATKQPGDDLLIRIRVEGPDADGRQQRFEARFLDDQPALADGRAGVALLGSNPAGTSAAWFDDLQATRPAD